MAARAGYRMLLNCKVASINTRLTNRNSDTVRLFHDTNTYYRKDDLKKGEKLKGYVLSRYMQYVKNYERLLEKRFPSAMKVYRIFSIGIQDFYKDLKQYLAIRAKIRNMDSRNGLQGLSRQEIEIYQKMPRDMCRIAPVLLLSTMPFGNYVIFPLALLKPRTMLCSHFWSIQQRSNFAVADLTDRIIHNRPVFRFLQAQLDAIKDEAMRDQWSQILGLVGSGVHPTAADVVRCKQLFIDGPYSLESLSHGHIKHLTQMHGLHRGFFRRKRLQRRAFLISSMDKAIIREGGVEILSMDVLKNCCFIRGLNGTHLSNKDMKIWLNQWLEVSQAVDDASYSLQLHCPILFGYNHPQNWFVLMVHPTDADVVRCKQLFIDGPYSLETLSHGHIKHLTQMHGLHRGFFRRKRLHSRAFSISSMDKAIIREGGVEILSIDVLKNCCFIRGLNGTHLSNKDMKIWLNQWLEVSQAVDDASYSLQLHCPILFGYILDIEASTSSTKLGVNILIYLS